MNKKTARVEPRRDLVTIAILGERTLNLPVPLHYAIQFLEPDEHKPL
jgi:hypothetical protein